MSLIVQVFQVRKMRTLEWRLRRLQELAHGAVDLRVLKEETVVTLGTLDVYQLAPRDRVGNKLLLGSRVQLVARHRKHEHAW